jgi:hypothetical protein
VTDFDLGIKHGYQWARTGGTTPQLDRLARESFRPKSIFDVAGFLAVRTTSLVAPLEDSLLSSSQFAEGFVTGALIVLAEIYSEVSILDSFHLEADATPAAAMSR